MFVRIGNEKKSRCVRPSEILDFNDTFNVVNFVPNSAYESVTLECENGLNILCKSQDYKEYLEIIKLSREAINKEI